MSTLGACARASPDPDWAPLPDVTADYAFLISFDANGTPVAASEAFAVVNGGLISQDRLLFSGVGAQRVALLAFDRRSLADLQGGLDRVTLEGVGLELSVPPESDRPLVRLESSEVRARLPSSAEWWELDRVKGHFEMQSGALADAVTLVLRTSSDAASAGVSLIDRPRLALPSADLLQVTSFTWLDANRGVFACAGDAPCGVGLVERGRAFAPDAYDPLRPGNWIPLEVLPPALYKQIHRMVLLPARSATVAEILLVGSIVNGSELHGSVWLLRATQQGLSLGPSPTIAWAPAPGSPPAFSDAAVSDDGAITIVGESATILTGNASRLVFEPRTGVLERFAGALDGPGGVADFNRVVHRHGESPTVIGTDAGQVIEGDAAQDRWDSLTDVGPWLRVIEAPRILGLLATEDPAELWLSGPSGGLARRDREGVWRAVPLRLPPSLGACAAQEAETGALHLTLNLTGVVLSGEHVFVSVFDCSAVIQLRRGDLAAMTVMLPDEAVRRLGEAERPILVDGVPPVMFGGQLRLSTLSVTRAGG